jgi:hypothetical protein
MKGSILDGVYWTRPFVFLMCDGHVYSAGRRSLAPPTSPKQTFPQKYPPHFLPLLPHPAFLSLVLRVRFASQFLLSPPYLLFATGLGRGPALSGLGPQCIFSTEHDLAIDSQLRKPVQLGPSRLFAARRFAWYNGTGTRYTEEGLGFLPTSATIRSFYNHTIAP